MATTTYIPLQSYKLESAQSSITFNSFSGYKDLVIVCNSANSVSTVNTYMTFNGDAGGNYSWTRVYGAGSGSGGSNAGTNATAIFVSDSTAALETTDIINIFSYSTSAVYKSALIRSSSPNSAIQASVGTWRNYAPITSINLYPSSNNWAIGSTFTIYGVK
jgi:hypothetical protein